MTVHIKCNTYTPELINLDYMTIHKNYVTGTLNTQIINSKLGNGLVSSILSAWLYHYKLMIRPDDIWIGIMNQFYKYLKIDKSKSINYRDDIQDIAKKLPEYLDDEMGWTVPNFSTTTGVDVLIVSLMRYGKSKKYDKFKINPKCGIPEITINGTKQDWINLKDKLKWLYKYDTESYNFYIYVWKGNFRKWVDDLSEIIDKIIEAYDKEDIEWWTKICDLHEQDKKIFISGWIKYFMSYTDDGNWMVESNGWIDISKVSSGVWETSINISIDSNQIGGKIISGQIGCDHNINTIWSRSDWYLIYDE